MTYTSSGTVELAQLFSSDDRIFRGTVVDVEQSSIEAGGGELPMVIYRLKVEESLKGDFERIEDVGATTTLMTRIFVERGIVPTPDEATMMMLGRHCSVVGFFSPV